MDSRSAALASLRRSGSEPRQFDSLPAELVSRILCLLGPCDVVHLRLVSKLFHDITFDPLIWKTIYSNACLPRPPGPFPSQSPRFLERTLIRSERLGKCWTTHPIRTISNTQIRLQGSSLGHPRIIGGRWLVTFESYRQIVFYDIETRARQVLWEDAGLITTWDACSVMSAGGLLVYVVLRKDVSQEICAPWKLLEFKVHEESGNLSHSASIDVPTKLYWQSVCLVADKTPFLYIMGRHLIFDTRTRTFYEFPEFTSGLDGIETHQYLISHRRVLLTSTHVVVVSYPLHQGGMPSSPAAGSTLVQTFVLPVPAQNDQGMVGTGAGKNAENQNGSGILRLSHEGMAPDRLANLVLIRNSIVDPATGATQLRFLWLQPEGDHLCFSCIDLVLPSVSAPGSFSAGPKGRDPNGSTPLMDIRSTKVFTVAGGVYDPSMSPCGYLVEASEDGYVRGCCRNRVVENDVNPSAWPSTPLPWFTNFTIDATGEECAAVVGQASSPLWAQRKGEDGSGGQDRLQAPPSFSTLSFDGVVGRFCYLKSGDGNNNWQMHGCVDVVVADIM